MFLQILTILALSEKLLRGYSRAVPDSQVVEPAGRGRRWRCASPCGPCVPMGFRNVFARASDTGTFFPGVIDEKYYLFGRPRGSRRSATAAALASAVVGDDEMKNLTTITWAHAVNNKTYLEAALASDVAMLEADIVLGQLIGKEGPPLPVMAHPPATSSDLSLGDFLTAVAQHNKGTSKDKQKGVKLDFKSIEAFEKAQDLIAPFSRPEVTFPLWLNADILPGPVAPTATPLDPARFLPLAARHQRAVLSVGWTTQYGGNTTEGEYSREQIGTMVRMLNTHRINQTVTFPVRAGLASNSQPVILDLLRETASLRSTITVWSAEGDAVSVQRLRALILTVGLERTYLDVPQELAARLALPPPATKAKKH